MRDFSALREAVARKGFSDIDTRNVDEFLDRYPCRYDHDDPEFLDCFWTSCEHLVDFGCRCVECNEIHAPALYSESSHQSNFAECKHCKTIAVFKRAGYCYDTVCQEHIELNSLMTQWSNELLDDYMRLS